MVGETAVVLVDVAEAPMVVVQDGVAVDWRENAAGASVTAKNSLAASEVSS